MNELNVTVQGDQKTLIVRTGTALEMKPPQVINVSGDIDTVKSFVKGRKDLKSEAPDDNLQIVDKEHAIISFDKQAMTISLEVDPQDFYGVKVKGSLQKTDELKQFMINEAHYFSRESLVKLIKFNKRFFNDHAQHDNVLKAFQNLSLTGNTELKSSSDTRGSKEAAFKKQLNTDGIPASFYLKIPVFKGLDPVKFLVEVCIENTEHSVQFWLESVELVDIIDETIDRIFKEQKEEFKEFVLINK